MELTRAVNTQIKVKSIRESIKEIQESFMGEVNSSYTWHRVDDRLHNFLEQLYNTQEISDYELICDERNNNAFTINYHLLIVSAYVVIDGQVFDVGGSLGPEAFQAAMEKAGLTFEPRYFD